MWMTRSREAPAPRRRRRRRPVVAQLRVRLPRPTTTSTSARPITTRAPVLPTPQKSTTKLAAIRFGIETTKVGMKTTAEFKLIDTMERDDSKTNEENWNAMLETLKEDEGCFIVFDMRFEHSGRQMYRPLLVSWCPDSLKVTDRMMIGSNKDQVKRDLTGIQKSLHAAEKDELTYEAAKTATV